MISRRIVNELFLYFSFISVLQVDGERQLILATDAQLNLLAGAKRWYADGTFKVVRKPFYQLWTIHAFLRKNDNVKQFPLLFCLISSRRKRDYKAVLRSVFNLLLSAPSVEEFVTDFESATWKAVASVLPETQLQGCAFHWGQALWRKTQELGLKRAYVNDDSTHKYVKKLLSLLLLPAEHIPPVFTALQLKANIWKKSPNKQRCRRVAPEGECRDAPFDRIVPSLQHPEHWSKAAEAEHASAIRRKCSPSSAGKRSGDTRAPHCAVRSIQERGDHSHEIAATLCWYIYTQWLI